MASTFESRMGAHRKPFSKLAYLSAMDIFRDLSPKDMEELDRMSVMQSCPRGQVIHKPGGELEILYLVKRGRVNIYRLSTEGRKLVLASLGPDTFFGEMPLLGQGMYDTFAEASEDTLLCVMTRSNVEQVLLTKPRVALRAIEALGRRLEETEARLQDLAFKDAVARVASLLLRLAREGQVVGLSHQELADMVGLYRETVTVALNRLKAAGLIDIGRKRIILRDVAGLRPTAQGEAPAGAGPESPA